MKKNRVMIAAPKSGSGKTIVTCALLQALKDRGQRVSAYKCGPDYIDPMFHERVIGISSKNLDTFFSSEEQVRELFLDGARDSEIAVFEGVMGLFDGLGGIKEAGSSYHLAKVTKTPIVLVVDAKGMGRSILPLLAGFLSYDTEHLIKGVLLNRISEGYFAVLKPLIEDELGLRVVGFLPEQEEFRIAGRHLGLVLPDELGEIQEKLQLLAEAFFNMVSLEEILGIAEGAEGIAEGIKSKGNAKRRETGIALDEPVIAVAKDEAFCFYYADNIRLLEQNGAKIEYFSPLWDERLPDGCDALLFGGGYPELYAGKLSENQKMLAAVYAAAAGGMPVVAECGGFLYLHSALIDKEGTSYAMAGVLPETCFYAGKSVRFGYVEIVEKQANFLPKGGKIKGHEFHYYDSANNGNAAMAIKPVTGKSYDCIIADERRWMGFAHLYYPSNPEFARAFVEKAKKYREGKGQEGR